MLDICNVYLELYKIIGFGKIRTFINAEYF